MSSLKDKIEKKKSEKINTSIKLNDVNKPLILALFGVSLFGKEGYDEDVLEIIIGKPKVLSERDNAILAQFNSYNATSKNKGGYYTDDGGKILLRPKIN